jgi:hypothetical protein
MTATPNLDLSGMAAHNFAPLDVKGITPANVRAKLKALAPHLTVALVVHGFTKDQLVPAIEADPETWEGYATKLAEWQHTAEAIGEVVSGASARMLVALAVVAERQAKTEKLYASRRAARASRASFFCPHVAPATHLFFPENVKVKSGGDFISERGPF